MKKLSLLLGLLSFMMFLGTARATYCYGTSPTCDSADEEYECNELSGCAWEYIIIGYDEFEDPIYDWRCTGTTTMTCGSFNNSAWSDDYTKIWVCQQFCNWHYDISPGLLNSPTSPTINTLYAYFNISWKASDQYASPPTCLLNINDTSNTTMGTYRIDATAISGYCYYNLTSLSLDTTYCAKTYMSYGSPSTANVSSQFCFTIEGGGDTTPPDISWNSPSGGFVTQNESWIFWNATISETGGSAILNINGTANYTMSWSGNYSYYNFTGSNTTTYCGKVYANDSSGNLNLSNERCATINLTSYSDIIPPVITIVSPINTNYTTTTIDLDVSADETTDAWWYSLNSGANTTFSPNTTIAAAQGINNLTVYANDTAGNIGSASVSFFVDSIAPDISWNSPTNNSVTQNQSWTYWNVTISETPDTCLLNLNGTLGIIMSKSGNYCYYNYSGANATTIRGRVYANDTYGNINLSSERWVTINLSMADIVPPNISIASPIAITYTTSSIALTVSANEPINTWWYNLNGGANASFTPNTTISGLTNGVYTLTIYANDLFGNVGMNSAVFTVQIPVISNLGMFAPIAGIAIGGGFLLFIIGLFLEEGANLARDPKKLAIISVGILIVAVLLSALFV